MPPREDSWQNKILSWVFTTAILLNISLSTWLVTEVMHKTTETDVEKMIEAKGAGTSTIIQTFKEGDNRMEQVIKDNTEALNALKIQLVRGNDVYRKIP